VSRNEQQTSDTNRAPAQNPHGPVIARLGA
jgi:hypothetical protein